MQLNNDGLMWALVKEKPEEGLWMKRVPIPEVGPKDSNLWNGCTYLSVE